MKRILIILTVLALSWPGAAQFKLSDKDLANVLYVMGQMYPEGFTLDLDTHLQ